MVPGEKWDFCGPHLASNTKAPSLISFMSRKALVEHGITEGYVD